VFVPGFISHVELAWEEPYLARFLRRLAAFSRVIFFDKRGTGLSDPVAQPPGLAERMDDIRAVMDAAVGTPLAMGLPVALERARTRGCLTLASTDPRDPPRIQLNLADGPEDLRRLMAGVRLSWQIAHQPEIGRHVHRVALLSEETMSSDDALASYVRATVSTQFHPCGTARMGLADDPMAVVDQHCRVRAIQNLRVVDASVMPTIPRANINLTCIMIGEHVSDWMREEA